jgi:hypothetical protein
MKTAVEWLIEQWPILESQLPPQLIEQAKEMEKEQIEKAYVDGFCKSCEGWNGEDGIEDFKNINNEIKTEQYYNETYKK